MIKQFRKNSTAVIIQMGQSTASSFYEVDSANSIVKEHFNCDCSNLEEENIDITVIGIVQNAISSLPETLKIVTDFRKLKNLEDALIHASETFS